jgi:hypothetical protein
MSVEFQERVMASINGGQNLPPYFVLENVSHTLCAVLGRIGYSNTRCVSVDWTPSMS